MADPAGWIVARNTSGYRTEVTAGSHTIVLDEPIAAGGTDAGADPYDVLVAALGGCTAITLRMYAQRKQWPLASVTVELKHSRSHAADDERVCADEPARLDQIEMVLKLDGVLSAEQRQRLREVALKCPLHRTLDAGVRIELHQD